MISEEKRALSNWWPQVERMYQLALGREASERAAFLMEACAGDEALRREVESLLAQERTADRLLAEPASTAGTYYMIATANTAPRFVRLSKQEA